MYQRSLCQKSAKNLVVVTLEKEPLIDHIPPAPETSLVSPKGDTQNVKGKGKQFSPITQRVVNLKLKGIPD